MNKAIKISVILAHHNGEKFLEEQIRSIHKQEAVEVELLIVDDSSQSIGHLERYTKNGNKLQNTIVKINKKRLGPGKTFVKALQEYTTDSNYFSFSDQDDVWFKDKLIRAIKSISKLPKDIPVLYCSRTLSANETITPPFKLSPNFNKPPSFNNALVQNIGGGNTMVFNKAARDIICQAKYTEDFEHHDWWAYILISGAGGTVIYDKDPTLFYRQHSNNVVGSNISLRAKLKRVKLLLRGQMKAWNSRNINLLAMNEELLTPENRVILKTFRQNREKGAVKRLSLLLTKKIYRQNILGNVGLFVGLLLKKV